MWRTVLAIVGVLIFIAGAVLLTVEIAQQQTEEGQPPGFGLIQLANNRAAINAGIGLLLGPLLTLPWWIRRLQREAQWFEKRDDKVDGPPRLP